MWQTWNILTIHNLEYASLTQFFMVRSVMLKDVGVYVYSPDQGSQRVRGWHTPTFKHTYYTCLLWSFNWRYQVPKFYNLQLSLKTTKSCIKLKTVLQVTLGSVRKDTSCDTSLLKKEEDETKCNEDLVMTLQTLCSFSISRVCKLTLSDLSVPD